MRTRAPAKINWTLEVLGKREDGYHEIRSVMQTIDLCDEVEADRSDRWVFEAADKRPLPEDDLVVRAARALERRVRRPLAAQITLQKRIPVASGLGGGSSDAAAVLRLLNAIYELGLTDAELSEVAANVGSDVPFFVYGGTALVEGRGELVTPLQDVPEAWLTIIVPRIELPNKTGTMYAGLTAADYTDGTSTDRVLANVVSGMSVNDRDTFNVFDRHTYEAVKALEELGHGLFLEGLSPVHVVGAGPSIFVYCDERARAERLGEYSEALAGESLRATGVPDWFTADTFIVCTLSRRESTSISNGPDGSPR